MYIFEQLGEQRETIMNKKQIILSAVFFLISVSLSFADQENMMRRFNLLDFNCAANNECVETTLDSAVIAADGSEYFIIDLGNERPEGFTSLQIRSIGGGTLKITHESSNDGSNFSTAIVDGTAAPDIVTAHTDGSAFYVFSTPVCEFLKINIDAINTTDARLTEAMLLVQ